MVVMAGDYEVLGVTPKATGPEIDRAYRRTAAEKNPSFGRADISPAEARRKSEELRKVIEAHDAITRRREQLIAAIQGKIKGIKQGAV